MFDLADQQDLSQQVEGLAEIIATRLEQERERLSAEFRAPGRVPACVIDDLLPPDITRAIHDAFPARKAMVLKNTIRERKSITAQMNQCDPLVEAAVFAFQHPRVIAAISAITGLEGIEGDPNLYAGGISAMSKGDFLNPHLDNSHDRNRARYRILNLLFYVSPDWSLESGGNLELWDNGPAGTQRTIVSQFNRLAIMATNKTSWHSVSKVEKDARRCCVSNYYFSKVSPDETPYFHATTYSGRPEEKLRSLVLKADAAARTMLLRLLGKWFFKNPHVYNKGE